MSSKGVIALVLAAGFSRRFDSDKRQAKLSDGRGLLQATLQVVVACYKNVFVVVQSNDDPDLLGVPRSVKVVKASNSEQGLGVSMAAGVNAIVNTKAEGRALAVILGDMPWIAPSTHDQLADLASAECIVRPRFKGQFGHPVLFGKAFWPTLQSLNDDRGGITVLNSNRPACIEVEVGDPNVLKDVDTTADLI